MIELDKSFKKPELSDDGYYYLKLETLSSVLDLICPYKKNYKALFNNLREHQRYISQFIFRGMSNSQYELIPSLYRNSINEFDGTDMQLKEFFFLRDFIEACDSTATLIPSDSMQMRGFLKNQQTFKDMAQKRANWVKDEWNELIAFAQHYGIPTRLLDWSYHPLVALYFAATGAISTMYEYKIKHNSDSCFTDLCFSIWIFADTDIVKSGENNENRLVKIIDVPKAANQHISFQKGCFTYVEQPLNDVLSIYKGKEYQPFATINSVLKANKAQECLIKIDIPYKYAIDLYDYCDSYNFNGATLFRGPHGSANYTMEMFKYKKVKWFLRKGA